MISLDEYRALLAGAGLTRRDDRGRLLLRGSDRLSYLHGLLTNDVQSLTPGEGRYAALLTAQGRMITDMRVFELGDEVLIDLDVSLTPAVREHLEKFVITEDVTIEDATGSLAQVGVYGPESARIVAESTKSFFEGAPVVLPSGDLGVAGFEIVVPTERAGALMAEMEQAGAIRVAPELLEITRVEAGVPKFLVDMDSTTIPLEAGIEDRAISMTKGCYVGQEVIVRVLHRGGGRVAKKLVGIRPDSEVGRGDRVWSGDKEVGVITSAVVSPRFGPIALGYVHRDFTGPETRIDVHAEKGKVPARVAAVPFVPDA